MKFAHCCLSYLVIVIVWGWGSHRKVLWIASGHKKSSTMENYRQNLQTIYHVFFSLLAPFLFLHDPLLIKKNSGKRQKTAGTVWKIRNKKISYSPFASIFRLFTATFYIFDVLLSPNSKMSRGCVEGAAKKERNEAQKSSFHCDKWKIMLVPTQNREHCG